MKNAKWVPNTSHNIYPIMHLWELDLPVDLLIWNLKLSFLATRCQYSGVDLPVDMLIWAVTIETWNCHSWPLDVSTWGVNLPLDLPMCTLTSILHVNLGKYELSELKSFILIWGCFGDVSWVPGCVKGCYIWHDSTMLTDYLVLKLCRNKRKFPPFLEESKMGAKYIP